METKNALKLLALIALISFSVNAATIHVAKGSADSLLGKAVRNSTANDTILVGAGTFLDTISINHKLTIIGAGKDSTKLGRAEKDSSGIPTVQITGKNIIIKKMTIRGHNGTGTANAEDTLTCWPTSDAMIISGAESVSIALCNIIGGNGIAQHSSEAARGGAAVIINKSSKAIKLSNDSLMGGYGYKSRVIKDTIINGSEGDVKQPLSILGASGYGLCIDTSLNITVDSSIIYGGNAEGILFNGNHNQGKPALVCYRAKGIAVNGSFLMCGYENYFGTQYVEVYSLWDSSSVLFVDDSLSTLGGIFVDETSNDKKHKTDIVLPFVNSGNTTNSLAVRPRDNWSQILVVNCNVTKASFFAIDLLNAKGQTINHVQRENIGPGAHEFEVNINGNKTSTLSNSVYFLKVVAGENKRCFRLNSVR